MIDFAGERYFIVQKRLHARDGRGLFDEELVPQDLTLTRMGKIIKDKYPQLDEEDQEAVRQHAIAALNLTQQAKKLITGGPDAEPSANTALIDGVRKFAIDWHKFKIKSGKWANRIHVHYGKTKNQLKKHRNIFTGKPM